MVKHSDCCLDLGKLDLGNLDDAAGIVLGEALKTNSTLTTLTITGRLSGAAGTALAVTAQDRPSVTQAYVVQPADESDQARAAPAVPALPAVLARFSPVSAPSLPRPFSKDGDAN